MKETLKEINRLKKYVKHYYNINSIRFECFGGKVLEHINNTFPETNNKTYSFLDSNFYYHPERHIVTFELCEHSAFSSFSGEIVPNLPMLKRIKQALYDLAMTQAKDDIVKEMAEIRVNEIIKAKHLLTEKS